MTLGRASRFGWAPPWAIAVTVTILLLVALLEAVRPANDAGGPSCLVRRVTGVPCPTCGSTRVATSLVEGDPIAALMHNPLVFAACVLAAAWLVLRVGFGRTLQLSPRAGTRRVAWVVMTLALVANWIYVMGRH